MWRFVDGMRKREREVATERGREKSLFLPLSKYFANCSSIKVFTRPSTIVTFIANARTLLFGVQ